MSQGCLLFRGEAFLAGGSATEDIFCHFYRNPWRKACRETKSVDSKHQYKHRQTCVCATNIPDNILSDLNSKMVSYHHGNKRCCVDMFWGKMLCYSPKKNVSGEQVLKENKKNNVQMPQPCSLAVQVEACSTLLPIYSTNMGCSAFTECLLLGELAPSC